MSPERIYITGGPGSGKSTLAEDIAERTGLPLHHLDEVARVGGGGIAPERSPEERQASVDEILAQPGWIAEGVHLGWTQPLMAAADLIVWLDHVPWQRSTGRIVRRFVKQAAAESGRRRGIQRFFRPRDYARRLRELAAAIPETRSYRRSTRVAAGAALAPFADKVAHCRSAADVDGVLNRF